MKHTSKKPLWIALACVLVVAAAAFCLWFFWLRNLWGAASASPVYVESVADITGINTGDTPRFSGVVEPQATYEIKKDDTKTVAEIYVSERSTRPPPPTPTASPSPLSACYPPDSSA